MFAQGGKCFFCGKSLARADASVEHLLAKANGGIDGDGNCVACCKTVNALFGSMSLKDKFRVVLNQGNKFACPASLGTKVLPPPTAISRTKPLEDRLQAVVANLVSHKSAKPRTEKTLRNSIANLFPAAPKSEIEAILTELKATGKVEFDGTKVKRYVL